VVCLLASLSARAQEPAAEAKAHYQRATNHFAVGEFSKAADEYQEAYKLKPDPALLFNAAQARRLAGENAVEVRDQIAKLQEAVTAAEKAKTAPPTGTVKPEGEPATAPSPPTTPPPPTTTTPPPETAAAPPPSPSVERTPVYKKWWLWTIVGAVVAAGVVTTAVLAQPQVPGTTQGNIVF
jgi:tetratricopeptide (TPR) repeat protein